MNRRGPKRHVDDSDDETGSSASSAGPTLDSALDQSLAKIRAAVQVEREEMLGDLNATLAEVKEVQASNKKELEELRMWWPVVNEAQRYVVFNEESTARQTNIEEEFYEYAELSTQHLKQLGFVVHQNLEDIKLEAKQMRAMARLGHERPNIFTPARPSSAATPVQGDRSTGRTSRPGSAVRRMYDRSSTPQNQGTSRPSTACGDRSENAANTTERAAPSPFPSYSPSCPSAEVNELELQGTRCINTTGRRSQILVPSQVGSQGVTTLKFSHFVTDTSSSVLSTPSRPASASSLRRPGAGGAAPLPSKNRHHVHLMAIKEPSGEEGEDAEMLHIESSVARVTIPNDCGNYAVDVCYKSKVMVLRSLPASPRRQTRSNSQGDGEDDEKGVTNDPARGLESFDTVDGCNGVVVSRDGVWSTIGQAVAAGRLRFAFTLVQQGSLVDVEL